MNTEAHTLRGGFAAVNITPPLGISMEGYVGLDRLATGVADELFARAILLDNGDTRLAIVSCDVLGLDRDTVQTIRGRVQSTTGIPPEAVLIACTHNHTGPQTLDLYRPKDQGYMDLLVRQVVSAVRRAYDNLIPVVLGVGAGFEPTLVHNRRVILKDGQSYFPAFVTNADDVVAIEGPTDPTVGVITVADQAGKVRGILVNYSTHVDVITGDQLSADYPGVMVNLLQRVYGPETVAMFTAGACGDVDPIGMRDLHFHTRQHYHDSEGPTKARQVGTVLAAEAMKVIARLNYTPTAQLGAASRCLSLPTRRPSAEQVQAAQRTLDQQVDSLAIDTSRGKISTEEWNVRARNLARATLRFADFQARSPHLPVEVQALRIGETVLLGIPGELFSALGRAIIEGSPAAHTFVLTYTNDYLGYIPTRVAYEHGGYETIPGWANQLEPEAGERLVEEAVALAREVMTS